MPASSSRHSREEPLRNDPHPFEILCSPERFRFGTLRNWKSVLHHVCCTRLVRFPDPDFTFLTYSIQTMIATDIRDEVLYSAKTIYICFRCELFSVGKVCYSHHIRQCLCADIFTELPHSHLAPSAWNWSNCGHCFRQEVLSEWHDKIPGVSSPLHWARLLRLLIWRRSKLAPWLNVGSLRNSPIPFAYEISLFVSWDLTLGEHWTIKKCIPCTLPFEVNWSVVSAFSIYKLLRLFCLGTMTCLFFDSGPWFSISRLGLCILIFLAWVPEFL
jgi:hypothetical protein